MPERWLDDERYKNDRRDAVMPFSVGPRSCIGIKYVCCLNRLPLSFSSSPSRAEAWGSFETAADKHVPRSSLAYLELRLVLAKVVWHFDLALQKPGEEWTAGQKLYTTFEKKPLLVKMTPVRRQ